MNPNSTNAHPVIQRKLDSLKTHPSQGSYFRDLPQQEIQRLAEDIKMNGLRHPVEILSDGTIICGHQRVAAARSLGWTQIDTVVRADLEAKGEQAVEEALIGDNLHRRQLDPIEKARCIQRLRELHRPTTLQQRQKREKSGAARDYEKGTFREYLGKELGMSGRTVDRYLAVLKAPRVVQDAVSEGKLPLTQAAKVAALSEESRARIEKAAQAGGNVKEIVGRHLKKKAAPAIQPTVKSSQDHLSQLAISTSALVSHVRKGKPLSREHSQALAGCIRNLRALITKPSVAQEDLPGSEA